MEAQEQQAGDAPRELIPVDSHKKRRGHLERHERIALLQEVEEKLIWCVSTWKIQQELGEKYKVTGRTIKQYISRVYRRWEAEEKVNPDKAREKQLHRLAKGIREATEANNFAAAAAFEALYSRVARTAPNEFGGSKNFFQNNTKIINQTSVINNKLKVVSNEMEQKIRALPVAERERMLDLLSGE